MNNRRHYAIHGLFNYVLPFSLQTNFHSTAHEVYLEWWYRKIEYSNKFSKGDESFVFCINPTGLVT
jgi:hypothetical protein